MEPLRGRESDNWQVGDIRMVKRQLGPRMCFVRQGMRAIKK